MEKKDLDGAVLFITGIEGVGAVIEEDTNNINAVLARTMEDGGGKIALKVDEHFEGIGRREGANVSAMVDVGAGLDEHLAAGRVALGSSHEEGSVA